MDLQKFKESITKVIDVSTKLGYLNHLNQLIGSLNQLADGLRGKNSVTVRNVPRYRQQVDQQKAKLLGVINQIREENPDLFDLRSSYYIDFDRFFGVYITQLIDGISDANLVDSNVKLGETVLFFNNLSQVNSILDTLSISSQEVEEKEYNGLDILFSGETGINNLKELSKEATQWNQHIICFSRLAKENDTEAKISSIRSNSPLLLTIFITSGAILASLKAVDKIMDTIIKFTELRKKFMELKLLNLQHISEAVGLLDKLSKLNTNQESERITNELLTEYGWDSKDELYNETKTATQKAVSKLLQFINVGGKIDGRIKEIEKPEDRKIVNEIKVKNERIKEIESKMKEISNAKAILLLDEGKEEANGTDVNSNSGVGDSKDNLETKQD